MAKYSEEIVQKIVDLIELDSFTVSEICNIVGLAKSTFFHWQNTKTDFSDRIRAARVNFDEKCISIAQKSLLRKIQGYTIYEEQIVYTSKSGCEKVKVRKVNTRYCPADTNAIIFLLINKCPDEFCNPRRVEKTSRDTEITVAPCDIKLFDEEFNKKDRLEIDVLLN